MLPNPRSLLLIRLSSMGDVVLSTPLVRQLRTRFPQSRIDMLVDERFVEIVQYNPRLDNVFSYKRTASRAERTAQHHAITNSLQSQQHDTQYDCVIDLQHNRRSAAFHRCSKTTFALNKHRLQKLALVYAKHHLHASTIPIAERYRLTAQALDVADDGGGCELWLPEERRLGVYPPQERTLAYTDTIRIALAPGAQHTTKRWLPKRFAETALLLAERLKQYGTKAEFILVGGVADVEVCQQVVSVLNALKNPNTNVPVVNTAGAPSVYATVRILDTCTLLLTNDTGVMHLAAARQVPVLAVFGSTVQEFGFAPFRVEHRIAEVSRDVVPCRPCTHIGRSRCPKKHFRCMTELSAHSVAEQAWELLAGKLQR